MLLYIFSSHLINGAYLLADQISFLCSCESSETCISYCNCSILEPIILLYILFLKLIKLGGFLLSLPYPQE